jgi:hypothetical protein
LLLLGARVVGAVSVEVVPPGAIGLTLELLAVVRVQKTLLF